MSNLISLIDYVKEPDESLIKSLEELLADAKAGKIKQIIYVYECADQDAIKRFKHRVASADSWKMLGIIEDVKLAFWKWMNE